MRGMQKAVVLLAVMMCGILTMNAARAGAVAREDLEIAIKKAELAVLIVKSSEYDAQKTYLRDKVALAKKAVLNFDKHSNEDLQELVATLEEGARALRLTSGVDRKENSEKLETGAKDKPTAETTNAKAPATTVREGDGAKSSTEGKVASVDSQKSVDRRSLTGGVDQVQKVAENKSASEQVAQVDNEDTTTKDGEFRQSGEEAWEIEVPRTGDEDEPSTVAVAITVGVVVGLSAAGAVAIVKRMKRNL